MSLWPSCLQLLSPHEYPGIPANSQAVHHSDRHTPHPRPGHAGHPDRVAVYDAPVTTTHFRIAAAG
jgi:hypothetical protein